MRYWLAWAATLLLAILLSCFASEYEAPTVEADAINAVADLPVPGSLPANLAHTITGTEPGLAVGFAIVVLLWFARKPKEAAVLAVLLVLLLVVQHELKMLIDRPRPHFDPDLLWVQPSSPSFPSGHVMSTTVVYGYVLWLAIKESWQRPLKLAAITLAAAALCMSSIGSIYLSVHWPSDALGGYAWGLALLLPVIWWVRSRSSLWCFG